MCSQLHLNINSNNQHTKMCSLTSKFHRSGRNCMLWVILRRHHIC